MKLSIFKKMTLLLAVVATVQGFAAKEPSYMVTQNGVTTQYSRVLDEICGLGCISQVDNYLLDIGAFSFDAKSNKLVIQDLNTSLVDGVERVYTISAYGKDGKTSYWYSDKFDQEGLAISNTHYDYGYFNKENGTPCTSTFLLSETFTANGSGRHVFDLTSFINALKEYHIGQVRLVLENLQFYDVNYSDYKKYEKILKYENAYERNGVTYGVFVDIEFPPFHFHVIQNPSFEVPKNGSEKVSLTLWSSKAFSFQLEMKDRDDDDNHWAVVRSGNYSLSEVNRVITLSEEVFWKGEPGEKNYRWKINCDGIVYYSNVYSVYNELPRLTFLGFEGEELWSDSVIYGGNPTMFAPHLPVKEDTEELHYYVKWTPEIVPVTEDATYKAELDSALKDPAAYVTIKYEYGEGVSWETNSDCVKIRPQGIVFDSKNYFFEKDGSIGLAFAEGDYKFLFGVKVGLNQCNDFFAKSLRYYNDGTTDFYVNGTRSDAYASVTEKPEDGLWASYVFDFTIVLHTVTFFDEKNAQVGDAVKIAGGMAVAAPAEPAKREGYTFAGWFEKDAVKAYDFMSPVNDDLNLYEKWTVNKYEIAVSVNDSKMGSVKGAGKYEYGTEVELVATAAEGYKFANWKDDAKAAATRKVVVKANAEYTANFKKIPESSSSSAKSNSSSKTDAKSSSSAKGDKKSSSSSKSDAVMASAAVPQFSVAVVSRNVQIAGARVGSAYAVLDMQGRVMYTGRVTSANFSVEMPRAGSYMVRVGSLVQRVNVK